MTPFSFVSCQTTRPDLRNEKYDPMANFLPYLNQKVTGYIQNEAKSDALNAVKYKEIVEQVCFPLPSCNKNAKLMFQSYQVKVRQVNTMFTVLLCDIDGKEKIMEDFSCTENETDIRTYEKNTQEPCGYEPKETVEKYCRSK